MDIEPLKVKVILKKIYFNQSFAKHNSISLTTNGAESFDECTYNGEIRIGSTLFLRDFSLFSFDLCTSHDEIFGQLH